MSYDIGLTYAVQHVDVSKIVRHYLPQWRPKGGNVLCPLHDDTQTSLSIELHPRLGAFGKCFGCGEKIKHLWDLVKKIERKGTWREWAEYWYEQFVPTIPLAVCDAAMKELTPAVWKYLKQRGLKAGTIKRHRIGYDEKSDRITIPVFDLFGNCVDIKRFKWKKEQKGAKQLAWRKGYGKTRLFNPRASLSPKFFLVEGFWDSLILDQAALPSVCFTNGANSWGKEDSCLFAEKEILLCFDSDVGGTAGEAQVREHFHDLDTGGMSLTYRSVPPPSSAQGIDISDWYNADNSVIEYFRDELVQEPKPPETKPSTTTFEDVQKVFHDNYLIDDPYLIALSFGAILANRFFIDPVWMMLVGPPGSLKSEIIRSMGAVSYTRSISQITGKTLLSGLKPTKRLPVTSLLAQLKDKIILMKDFTTVLKMPVDSRHAVLSQLREIHDGYITADFGSGVHHFWVGHLGLFTGVTDIIDKHIQLQAVLGERFLMYRLNIEDPEGAARRALENIAETERIRAEVAGVVTSYLEQFTDKLDCYFDLGGETIDRLTQLATLVAYGRAGVSHTGYGRRSADMKAIIEIPTRVARILAQLGQGIAVLYRIREFDERVWAIITKVVQDSMQRIRRQVLFYLYAHDNAGLRDMEAALRMPPRIIWETINDLWVDGLEMVEKNVSGGLQDDYEPTEDILVDRGKVYQCGLTERGKKLVEALRGGE